MVPGIWPSSGLWNGPVLCDFELVFRLHAARAQECTAGSHETEMVHLIESSLRVLSMWQGSAADLVRGLHSHCLHCTVVSMSTIHLCGSEYSCDIGCDTWFDGSQFKLESLISGV
eukprot:scpid80897/ scgid4534/ 